MLTVVLLLRAMGTVGAIRPRHYVFFEETLPPLSYPPVPKAVQQNLHGTDPADPCPRGGGIGVDTSGHRMEIYEEF